MREILFRGKRSYNDKWVKGYCFIHDFYYIYSNDENMYQVIESTVGQFTGEYDANGIKIYEHDIVRKFVNERELTGVVEYSDGAFGVRFADGEGQFLCFFENDCEVIGNIHDNPELIER